MIILVQVGLFSTRWGLRVRAVGEHPTAADTVGIRVLGTRYRNVILGGLIAGIGGAYLTIGSVGTFNKDMSSGLGYIALAAMIFGRWTPLGALAARAAVRLRQLAAVHPVHHQRADPVLHPADGALPGDDHRRGRAGRPGPGAGRRRTAVRQGMTSRIPYAAASGQRGASWPRRHRPAPARRRGGPRLRLGARRRRARPAEAEVPARRPGRLRRRRRCPGTPRRSARWPSGRPAGAGLPRPDAPVRGPPGRAVVHGVRTAVAAGCRVIVLTNAAGGIRAGYGRPAGADQRPAEPDRPVAAVRRRRRPTATQPGSPT